MLKNVECIVIEMSNMNSYQFVVMGNLCVKFVFPSDVKQVIPLIMADRRMDDSVMCR